MVSVYSISLWLYRYLYGHIGRTLPYWDHFTIFSLYLVSIWSLVFMCLCVLIICMSNISCPVIGSHGSQSEFSKPVLQYRQVYRKAMWRLWQKCTLYKFVWYKRTPGSKLLIASCGQSWIFWNWLWKTRSISWKTRSISTVSKPFILKFLLLIQFF